MNGKVLYSFTILFLLYNFTPLLSQQESADPLNKTPTLIESGELVLVWSEKNSDGNTYRFGQKIYDYNDANPTPPNQLTTGIRGNEADAVNNSQVAAATGDFNGDGLVNLVSAYITSDNKVRMVIPEIDPADFGWQQVNNIASSEQVTTSNEYYKRIKLTAGNFDADREDEFILAYIDNTNKIRIELYDTDGTLSPLFRGSIADESSHDFLKRFNIALGDFNEDGIDEIALTGIDPAGGGDNKWGIFVKVYEVSGTDPFVPFPKAREIIFTQPPYNIPLLNLGLTTADFNEDTKIDLAFSFSFLNEYIGENDSYLYLMEVGSGLDSIVFSENKSIARNSVGQNEMTRNDLTAGDLNSDGKDEIFWGIGGSVYIYEPDTALVPIYKNQIGVSQINSDDQLTNNYLAVFDIDRDLKDDIAIAESFYNGEPNSDQYFRIRVYGSADNTLTNLAIKAQIDYDENIKIGGGGSEYRNYALAHGDFNGDRVRLGVPNRYRVSDVLQPMVILNAPPVHFDIIDGTVYDLNSCYNGSNCEFFSRYEKSSTQSVEVSSEINRDWGVDATLSGGASYMGVGVKASLTASYGEKFKKAANSSQKVTIGVQVTASEDDYIYATVVDYDVWEYPVYNDSGFQGNIVVLNPLLKENRWFPGKSWSGSAYKPDHEIGNILSYYAYTQSLEENENLAQRIKGSLSESFVLNGSSNIDWYQTFEEFQSSQVQSSWSAGLEVGASIGGWGVEAGVKGHYNKEEISTHTTSVGEQISLNVHLDGINTSQGEMSYLVTPYSYWAKNGALVIDYAVRPELSSPGGTPTWWQVNYQGKPDPAFILPWKNDPEKGFFLENPEKRYQTKEITFHPASPMPGDTVTVTARVHNFSLTPTDDNIYLKFYTGNPDSGGTLISSLDGQTVFSTSGFIPARGNMEVKMQWSVPSGLPLYSRIYAVIDPDNQVDELQVNNNKGWTVLGTTIPTYAEEDVKTVENFTLSQNYPNPFNPETSIKYSIPQTAFISIKIYDVLGREITSLINIEKPAGSYELKWDGKNLSSGVYFYMLKAGDFIQTKKMMMLK